MQEYADYIVQIEIDSLWSGRKHIKWDLDRKVNILSGINGEGKSTILNKVVKSLGKSLRLPLKAVSISAFPLTSIKKYLFTPLHIT